MINNKDDVDLVSKYGSYNKIIINTLRVFNDYQNEQTYKYLNT